MVGSRILPEHKDSHIAQKVNYSVDQVLSDLLHFAAERLVLRGRLVFWLPSTNEFSIDDVPLHPCLKLVSFSTQPITRSWGRTLITMEKTQHYEAQLGRPEVVCKALPAHLDFSAKVLNDAKRSDDRRSRPAHEQGHVPFVKRQRTASPGQEGDIDRCTYCGVSKDVKPLKACSMCNKAAYCSSDHFRLDNGVHYDQCRAKLQTKEWKSKAERNRERRQRKREKREKREAEQKEEKDENEEKE